MLVLSLLSPAVAGSVFASKDAEVSIGGGTWGRLHPIEAGWQYFTALGGDSQTDDLADDLSGYEDQGRLNLTNQGNLQDVQVERCDDGGWLVAGSYTVDSFDDSAHAWRFEADFTPVGDLVIEERETDRAHNDMAVLCSDVVTGVAYANRTGSPGSTFFDIDGTTLGATHTLDINAMGGSLAIRPSDDRIVSAHVDGPQGDEIQLSVYDPDWTLVERTAVPVPEGYAFWPQRLLPLGDGWVLVYLVRPEATDTGDGDVWLMALDADFSVVDSLQITPDGMESARPWVVRKDDVLAVSYDRDITPRVTLVRLQADAVPEEDGLPDTGGDAEESGGTCGCGKGAEALVLVPFALLVRRRRQRTA